MTNDRKYFMRLGLLNARSLNTGSDELFVTVQKNIPDILAINETWLKAGEESLAPVLPGYKFLHKARQGKKGGGVGFYIRQGINFRTQSHPASILEQFWLEVRLSGVTLAIGTAYRPETVAVSDALDGISESLNVMAHCDHTCFLGDLNIDIIRKETTDAIELGNFCKQHNLEQLIKEPTRITETTRTIIDVVITDIMSKCRGVQVIHNPCLSDHAMILVDFDIMKPKLIRQIKFRRKLSDINLEQFKYDLKSIPWHLVTASNDVDIMVEMLNNHLISLFDIHAPLQKIICKNTPKPWITSIIKFMMTLRDKALIKAHMKKNESSKNYYRDLKNLVTSATDREKRAFINNYINNTLHQPIIMWHNLKNTVIPKVQQLTFLIILMIRIKLMLIFSIFLQ